MSEARLAQSVERKALNLVVVGSNPTVGVFSTIFFVCSHLHFPFFFCYKLSALPAYVSFLDLFMKMVDCPSNPARRFPHNKRTAAIYLLSI